MAEGDNQQANFRSLQVLVDLTEVTRKKTLATVTREAVQERMRDHLAVIRCKIADHKEAMAALQLEEMKLCSMIEENKQQGKRDAPDTVNEGDKKARID